MAELINVEELASEVKTKLEEMQAQSDERAKAIEEKGVDIETLKKAQEDNAKVVEAKITQLENICARMASVSATPKVEEDVVNQFNLELKHLNFANQREHKDFTAQEVKIYAHVFNKFVTKGMDALTQEEVKQLNTANDAQGGYLVVPEVSTTLINKKFDGYGIFSNITQKPSSGRYEVVVDYDDYDKSYFQKELVEDSSIVMDENFAKITFNANVVKYGKKFSRVMLEDAFINVESDVLSKMDAGMTRTVSQLVASGAGGTVPRGLLTYPAGTNFGQIEQITSGTTAKLTFADVISLLPAQLKDPYHKNAKFAMRRATFFGLLAEADTTGKLQLSNMINFFSGNGVELSILGYAVIFDAGMPAVATGALSVAFGDFAEAYILISTPTTNIVRNETHPDYITLWERKRFDGKVVNFEAIKLLKIK